ncbi:MAG: CoA transferase, partial [Chloroflexota bacterium]|nr:CoA transferase [Chloroflexota bacterium]
MREPLLGIVAIDLTQSLAGPYCTLLLGDLGAEVIKIERPGVGDMSRGWGPPFINGESAYFLSVNRNKKSITLDLKRPEGVEILRKLASRADVLVANFPREEQYKAYGIDYPTLRSFNPRIIACSLTGYGMTGPDRGRVGYDITAQAASGIMSITGEPEGEPTKFGVSIADLSAGMNAAIGIISALFARERTGEGQFIDISLLDGQIALLGSRAVAYLMTGASPKRYGNAHHTITPFQSLCTQDKPIVIAAGTEELWRRLCQVLGLGEAVAEDPRFRLNRDRTVNREALVPVLEGALRKKPAQFWLECLREAGIPCDPINTIPEALEEPQVLARG